MGTARGHDSPSEPVIKWRQARRLPLLVESNSVRCCWTVGSQNETGLLRYLQKAGPLQTSDGIIFRRPSINSRTTLLENCSFRRMDRSFLASNRIMHMLRTSPVPVELIAFSARLGA